MNNVHDTLKIDPNSLKMRQQYYFEGRACEAAGNLEGAITVYEQYSNWLKAEDRHIPHQWISELYERLSMQEASLKHLSLYAEGCTPPRAAEVFKDIGAAYERLNQFDKALEAYESAVRKNPKMGIRKRMDELKLIIAAR